VTLKVIAYLVQAYLETDPSSRDLPESYTLRYRSFAMQQVENAINMHDRLSEQIGKLAFHVPVPGYMYTTL
jgi:hypothetical protein